jgi:hypothetical protein
VALYDADHPYWPEFWGFYWPLCDGISLFSLIISNSDFLEMRERLMSAEELAAYRALPEVVTVYRGCYIGINDEGFSWSRDEGVARGFPFLTRYVHHGETPILLTAKAARDRIRFLKLRRDESEVVIPFDEVDDVTMIGLTWPKDSREE